MDRKVQKISKTKSTHPKFIRVAAYARVSTGKDAMKHSLSVQVSYYNSLIQKHPGWQFCGVYADEALTGTKADRDNFQALLADCRAGKIDMVITKSISRFARNTVTLLETVRELKSIGVDVYFEEENIHSLTSEGELMLTILASYAQEESRSASENMKWRIKKNFEEGKPWTTHILGYHYKNSGFVINEEEAETVRKIFKYYLDGLGRLAIANRLDEEGCKTKYGGSWTPSAVSSVLKNYAYTGNLILQTTYHENHLTKKKRKNTGQLPMYHATQTHEAIIPLDTYIAVQKELERRSSKYSSQEKKANIYPFTGLIYCEHCGKSYNRKTSATRITWVCSTYNTKGKSYCPLSKQIPENALIDICKKVLDITEISKDSLLPIRKILIGQQNSVTIYFQDGSVIKESWTDRSRSESWTDEMKNKARIKTLERSNNNASSY